MTGRLGIGIGSWRPPVHRRQFWIIQAAVLAIIAAHLVVEVGRFTFQGVASAVLTTMFIVPVVYAASTFGRAGYLPTAAWCAIVGVPSTALLHAGHDQVRELSQVATVVVLAVFVGSRVDREKAARIESERREAERRASEEKYRGVFDHVEEPILLLDGARMVLDANTAAVQLFGLGTSGLIGQDAAELVGLHPEDLGEETGTRGVREISIPGRPEPGWIEPVVIPFAGPGGSRGIQLMLRDVTGRHLRQQELEAYTGETIAAPEAERRRIARELHDGPLQSLILLWRKLDTLAPLVDEPQRSVVAEAQAETRSIGDELRRLSRDLRPSTLDDLGLGAALRAEAEALGRRSGLSVDFQSSGAEQSLSSDLELILFRIAQEALRNVERHAVARSARVDLEFGTTNVTLRVTDDGTGLEPAPRTIDLLAERKFGIIGMQERARLARAALTLHSESGKGTTIEVVAPY